MVPPNCRLSVFWLLLKFLYSFFGFYYAVWWTYLLKVSNIYNFFVVLFFSYYNLTPLWWCCWFFSVAFVGQLLFSVIFKWHVIWQCGIWKWNVQEILIFLNLKFMCLGIFTWKKYVFDLHHFWQVKPDIQTLFGVKYLLIFLLQRKTNLKYCNYNHKCHDF